MGAVRHPVESGLQPLRRPLANWLLPIIWNKPTKAPRSATIQRTFDALWIRRLLI